MISNSIQKTFANKDFKHFRAFSAPSKFLSFPYLYETENVMLLDPIYYFYYHSLK